MSDSPYPYKTLTSYNMGATIWSDTTVLRPDFGTELSVAPIQEALERTFAVLYFIGSGGVSDVYINGTSPKPAGYTPAVPIKILGAQGLFLEAISGNIADSSSVTKTGPTVLSGGAAVVSKRVASLPPLASVISTGADEWKQGGVPAGVISHTVKSSSPTPPDGAFIRIWKAASGFDVVILREDASEIVTLGTAYSSADITYYASDGKWRLSSLTAGCSLATATP